MDSLSTKAVAVFVVFTACLATPSAVSAAPVKIPLHVSYALLSDVLRQRLYVHGGRAEFWKGDNDCEYFYGENPAFGQRKGIVQVNTGGHLNLGVPLGDHCLAPITWSGIVEADTAPYIAGFALKLHVTDVNLYDVQHKKTLLVGRAFDLIKGNLTPALETYSFDLTPAIRELDGLAEMAAAPGDQAALHLALATIRLERAIVVGQSGVELTMIINLPPRVPVSPLAASAAPLTSDEIAAWNNTLDNWDAFLVFAIKQIGATVSDPKVSKQLLEILLDSRERLVAALAEPQHAAGADPVRLLFLREWTRLGQVIENAAEQGRLGNRSLEFLSFISAGDALFALDQAASALGLRISAGDLRRLARIIAPRYQGDPLTYSFAEDPELRQMFGLSAPLEQPGTLDIPSDSQPADAARPGGVENSPRLPSPSPPLPTTVSPDSGPLSMLSTGLCTISPQTVLAAETVPNAQLNTDGILALGRKLHAVVVDQHNAVTYRRDLGRLLDLATSLPLEGDADDPSARRVWPILLKAAAWQESCWRQFVMKHGRIWFLESKSGDIGLMQVNKYVWRGFYSLPRLRWDIVYNLSAGSQILRRLLNGALDHLHSSDAAALARASYAAYNGGPSAYNRWREPGEPRILREIDQAFWLKYQAIAAGQPFDILTCASQWDRIRAD